MSVGELGILTYHQGYIYIYTMYIYRSFHGYRWVTTIKIISRNGIV